MAATGLTDITTPAQRGLQVSHLPTIFLLSHSSCPCCDPLATQEKRGSGTADAPYQRHLPARPSGQHVPLKRVASIPAVPLRPDATVASKERPRGVTASHQCTSRHGGIAEEVRVTSSCTAAARTCISTGRTNVHRHTLAQGMWDAAGEVRALRALVKRAAASKLDTSLKDFSQPDAQQDSHFDAARRRCGARPARCGRCAPWSSASPLLSWRSQRQKPTKQPRTGPPWQVLCFEMEKPQCSVSCLLRSSEVMW